MIKIRFAIIFCLAFLVNNASSIAKAHTVSPRYNNWYWYETSLPLDFSSGQIVTPICDGKYDAVARELNRETILGPVNFYRINAGLAKLPMENFRTSFGQYGVHSREETRLRDAQRLLDQPQLHLSKDAIKDYLQTLNLSTSTGPALDWWLRVESFELEQDPYNNCNNNYFRHRGSKKYKNKICIQHKNIAQTAKKNTAYDWLMTNHQIQRARADWYSVGHLQMDEINPIFRHIDQMAISRPGINIWMAQYQHHKLFEHQLPTEINSRVTKALNKVISCEASPADYGILAMGDLGLPREYLPRVLAENRTRRDIHRLTLDSVRRGKGLDIDYNKNLLALVENLEMKDWAIGFLLLSSPDIETARLYAEQSGVHRSLYFGLPPLNMPENLPSMRMAHALTEGQYEFGLSLAPAAIAERRTVLEYELAKAKLYFERQINSRYKGYIQRAKVDLQRAESRLNRLLVLEDSVRGLPANIQLTLKVLVSQSSHNVNSHHRGIYQEQADGRFLDIFLRRRLFPATSYYHQRHKLRGFRIIPNAHHQGKYNSNSHAFDLPPLRKNDGTPENGLAALIDWNKLERISSEDQLLRSIARHLFMWLDTASAEQHAKYADLMAPALYDLIRICRHEDAGDINGAPVQQRAFERLHKYYPNSDEANSTPYWWASRARHGNHDL